MHIIFLNPQGNFDARDSHLTAHPDFGGQLVYVKEVAIAIALKGHKVDIITRQIDDPEWPEFSSKIDYYPEYIKNLRIVRIPCGGPKFLRKELLWDYLDEFVRNLINFYGDQPPDFATAHYADGGYCAALLKKQTGIGFTLTGHSLGAQKLDKLGMNKSNLDELEQRYSFSKRIAAERLAMAMCYKVITSTSQEHKEQYSHPLYQGAIDINQTEKFSVIPPGVNLQIFSLEKKIGDAPVKEKLDGKLSDSTIPWVLVASRLDEKKNIIGVVKAYAESKALQQKAGLAICIRGIDDPYAEINALPTAEKSVLAPILEVITNAGIKDRAIFLNIQSQTELAATYRYFSEKGSVFALTAFYEPFGLAPIEAAACGLACVATQNGGPSEIFEDGSGVLVDPFDSNDIAKGILEGFENQAVLAKQARQRVINKYTWTKTADGYLAVITEGLSVSHKRNEVIPELDAGKRIRDYINNN